MFFSIDARKNAVKRVEKTWGYELWFANDPDDNYCGKLLHINSGQKFSMHYHILKAETFYALNNKVKVRIIDTTKGTVEEGDIERGEAFEITRGLPHQLEACYGDVDIIEASTCHYDSDSYRVWR
jgi:mannose-6-phosphate isomerase-like protein (cupin superfamily)